MNKKKTTKSKETTIKIKFANKKAAKYFANWLCETGEQDYWLFQEISEEREEGDITAVIFDYDFEKHKITTVLGRLDSPENTPDIEE